MNEFDQVTEAAKHWKEVAQRLLTVLDEYKVAAKAFLDGTNEHKECTALKHRVILDGYIATDNEITAIIKSGSTPPCAVLGYHTAVADHTIWNVEQTIKALDFATSSSAILVLLKQLSETPVETGPKDDVQ